MDLVRAAQEPDEAPEWIEQLNGAVRKPEFYEWNPGEWHYYCKLCKYGAGKKADKNHVESDGHKDRVTWALKEKEWRGVVDYPNIRRVVQNHMYNYDNPHNLTATPAQVDAPWRPVGTPQTTPPQTPARTPARTPPPGLEHQEIDALTAAVKDLKTAVEEVKTVIQDQVEAIREQTRQRSEGSGSASQMDTS